MGKDIPVSPYFLTLFAKGFNFFSLLNHQYISSTVQLYAENYYKNKYISSTVQLYAEKQKLDRMKNKEVHFINCSIISWKIL